MGKLICYTSPIPIIFTSLLQWKSSHSCFRRKDSTENLRLWIPFGKVRLTKYRQEIACAYYFQFDIHAYENYLSFGKASVYRSRLFPSGFIGFFVFKKIKGVMSCRGQKTKYVLLDGFGRKSGVAGCVVSAFFFLKILSDRRLIQNVFHYQK